MKTFIDQNFLLENETGAYLFHACADKLPILDYHCHIDPEIIAADRQFENITQLWLGADHYKWRLMRSCGVEEEYITGNASDYDKFLKWAECLEFAVGNPLLHWSHLELQRYFDYHGVLNRKTAGQVWELCNKKLQLPSMSARSILLYSRVSLLCTTDDPADSLLPHRQLAEDTSFPVKVLPTFRPDKAMKIEKEDFTEYLKRLAASADVPQITSFSSLQTALQKRMGFFDSLGCRISDHDLSFPQYLPAPKEEIERIFTKKIRSIPLTPEEISKYKTAFLLFCGREYHRLNWAMQLHFGCQRDNNSYMFHSLGTDTGYDCISAPTFSAPLTGFLDNLSSSGELPRTVLYSLNPNDNTLIGTIIGCFQNSDAAGKIQQGSAWWFNDHKTGIRAQLISLANTGNLSGFIGMLTDSRSLLSYTRHEYFRRILCSLLGEWAESGEFPNNPALLKQLVEKICYNNAANYFHFR